MIEATSVVLSMIADGFIAALASKLTETLANKLQGESVKLTIKQATAEAIEQYSRQGSRLELAVVLLQSSGPLTQMAVSEELVKLVRPNHEPNLALIGDRWRAAIENPPAWRNFNEEAKLFTNFLRANLRDSEIFRPVFDSNSLDAIAINSSTTAQSITLIEDRLRELITLSNTQFGVLNKVFSEANQGIYYVIRDYSLYIQEKTRGFIGRKFVFDAITSYIRENKRGYFIIRGDPGIGKTAMLAQLVKNNGYVHHFNIRAEGVNKPAQFLASICAQLISQFRLDYSLLPTEATQDAGFLIKLLNIISAKLQDNDKAIIVVDALDEVAMEGVAEGSNVLFLPTILPERVFFVVTTRKTPLSLRIDCEKETLDIEQDSAGNVADIRVLIEKAVQLAGIQKYITAHGLRDQDFVDILLDKSQGNFMYLRYVLPEIEHGAYSTLDFNRIPTGLNNYYEDHWKRMRGQDEGGWFEYKLPVLMALVVVKEPVSVDIIANFSGVEQRARIRTVLNDWQQFLYEEQVPYQAGSQKKYRIYHASFYDFIARKDEIIDEQVSHKEAHKRLSKKGMKDLFGKR